MPAVREHPARALALIYHDPAFAGAFSLYWTPEGLLHQNVGTWGQIGYRGGATRNPIRVAQKDLFAVPRVAEATLGFVDSTALRLSRKLYSII